MYNYICTCVLSFHSDNLGINQAVNFKILILKFEMVCACRSGHAYV